MRSQPEVPHPHPHALTLTVLPTLIHMAASQGESGILSCIGYGQLIPPPHTATSRQHPNQVP
ncbi:hypothetical protein BDP27DRAFT_1335129 [Rhodocollybia butyracea]|uniref:Uncharacterized protein n=1 Tax=Rhodocollybia butyracea TaxID=206335 RepID=A0A9P5PK40_9AGAR|nr:hypothetical protein BDP27DRAFT_1335129 [Rhodocollybia butyracea]